MLLKSIDKRRNYYEKDTNVILGDKCKTIFGEDYITDILCDVKVRLSPLSFYQVNHTMAEKLYEKAKEYASPKGKNIIDLYYKSGFSAKKVGKIVGLSESGVRKILKKIQDELREYIIENLKDIE